MRRRFPNKSPRINMRVNGESVLPPALKVNALALRYFNNNTVTDGVRLFASRETWLPGKGVGQYGRAGGDAGRVDRMAEAWGENAVHRYTGRLKRGLRVA